MDYMSLDNTLAPSYVDDDSGSDVLIHRYSDTAIRSDFTEGIRNVNTSRMDDYSYAFTPETSANFTLAPDLLNATVQLLNSNSHRDSLSIILPVSMCYFIIFVLGVCGNLITCLVIAKNKTMHTATNYYLFNLAVSDFLVLIFGMPPDLYNIWYPISYPFAESVCVLQGLLSETSTNATILTITSFTCERYIAICHPFRSHTMSKLSRVVRFIFAIWILAFALAAPQAFQFGLMTYEGGTLCTVKNQFLEHAFEISSLIFFIVPMTVICVLYILIGLKLRKSKLLYGKKMKSSDTQRCIKGQTRVIRMLIAVVFAFLLCWAPFHAQRIMAIYGKVTKNTDDTFMKIYTVLTYISGITYFLSTCINPLLYSIMSHKFRNASKLTLAVHCLSRDRTASKKSQLGSNYSALTLRFGGIDNVRQSINRNFIIPSNQSSEILEIKDGVRNIDEVRNFAYRVDVSAPYMMGHAIDPYTPVANYKPTYEPPNNSCSQHTTSTTVSRDNSLKTTSGVNVTAFVKITQANIPQVENKVNTIAEKLRKCTQKVLTFKTDGNSSNIAKRPKMIKKISNDSIKSGNTISNSSLQEIDEEEFTSSELAQVMSEVNKEIKHLATQTS